MRTPAPIRSSHLFAPVSRELVSLLRNLEPLEWNAPTAAGAWSVRDVAAHLLDTTMRRVASMRDGWSPPPPPGAFDRGLGAFINELNREAVSYSRRLSPAMLIELHEHYAPALAREMVKLEAMPVAPFGVSWAGEDESPGWFDAARELTEQWHHQQQIRDAVGRPALYQTEVFVPVIDTFMRALPHAYRHLEAPEGTALVFRVGGCDEPWSLVRESNSWRLYAGGRPVAPALELEIDGDACWRLFTKGLTPDAARGRIRIEGEERYAGPLLRMICIVA